jgi:hypothetical protein
LHHIFWTHELVNANACKTDYDNAKGGMARKGDWGLVGEEGPELVDWGQSWRVLTADTTRKVLGAGMGGGGGNVYLTLDGVGVTFPGKMAGGAFIDVTTTVDWYGARVREALTQELINASARNSKIPYNDQGFSVIGNAVDGVNGQAVRAQHLNDGTTFVNLPLRRNLSSGNVTARNYPFTFGGQLTSAVLTIAGTGYVSDDGVAIALLASA